MRKGSIILVAILAIAVAPAAAAPQTYVQTSASVANVKITAGAELAQWNDIYVIEITAPIRKGSPSAAS
jgi:hypothetical protein